MMKSTDARERNYLAGLDRLYRSGVRGVLVQRQVCRTGLARAAGEGAERLNFAGAGGNSGIL
jgi:hypothetical protein